MSSVNDGGGGGAVVVAMKSWGGGDCGCMVVRSGRRRGDNIYL